MKQTELKQRLNDMEKKELSALICKLYKNSKQVQSMIDVIFCGDAAEEQLITECKKKIHASFFGKRLSLRNARTVISDFKKIVQNKERVAELMLFYVECGVDFTNLYGDIDDAFYSSIEYVFHEFVHLVNNMADNGYYQQNAERIDRLIRDTDQIGWGFAAAMAQAYGQLPWREEI